MHYYKRNIGDYAKKTGRLSMLQHGAYTLLIDACYDRERFPTLDEAIEWTWASTKEEIEAVEFILKRFFVLEGGIYTQKRIVDELENYRSNADTNKRIAIEREAKRREKSTNREQIVNEPPPNHKPRTKNQEPLTTNQEPRTKINNATSVAKNLEKLILIDFEISEDLQEDFLKHRKSLKAPITKTVLSGFQREADKAGISINDAVRISIERGWRGFKADWHNENNLRTFSQKPDKLDSTIQAGIDWLKGG